MASTIKLKNGSGAPTTGDLVQGEPALDLTNKRLYTENASGVVIEVGTNPSTIDINAGTIDGTVIGGSTAAAITGTTITGTSFVSSGDMTFGDNDKAVFGAGSDLQIFHDGASSTTYFIEGNATGNMEFRASGLRLKEGDGGNYYFLGVAGGSSSIYHNGSKKLETTATGIDVTGTVTATGTSVFASLDISGNIDVDGTIETDALTINSIGGLGNVANDLAIYSTETGHNGLRFHVDGILPTNNAGAIIDADADLGIETYRFKDLFLSGIASVGGIITPTAGTSNFIAGVNAGNSIIAGGNYNTVVGDEAGTALTTGDENVAVGFNSLAANTTGIQNTATGGYALASNTTAQGNTALGFGTLYTNTTGASNTAVGLNALNLSTTASNNTAVGYQSLYANTTGTENTATGWQSLTANTTGNYNSAFGLGTLQTNTTGSYNTGTGQQSLYSNTTASNNTASGYRALFANTTASDNTAVGYQAGYTNTTGTRNTFVGRGTGYTSNGDDNTAVGRNALYNNTTGSGNAVLGVDALTANTTGTENVAVGTNAGNTITTGNYNLCVGYNTDTGSASSDRRFVIGQDFNGTTNNAVHIGASGGHIRNDFLSDATWDQVSDVRKKTNIEDNSMGLEFINGLRTVIFNFKAPSEYPEEWQEYDASQTEPVVKDKKIGLIAQEVKAVIDELGIEHYDGIWGEKPNGQQEIGPSDYIFPLIKAIQELSTQLDAALARITTLEGAN
jgi:hypothetical protein